MLFLDEERIHVYSRYIQYVNELFDFVSLFSALQKECYYFNNFNNIQMVKLVSWLKDQKV